MDYSEFIAYRDSRLAAIDQLNAELSLAIEEMFDQLPRAGERVVYMGKVHHICTVTLGDDEPLFNLRKARKDGKPSTFGKEVHFLSRNEFECEGDR